MSDVILPPSIGDDRGYRRETEEQLASERGTQGILPAITYPMRPAPGNGLAVVGWWEVFLTPNGVWKNVWQAYIPQLLHSSLRVFVPIATDATGSGFVRISMTSSSGTVTTVDVTVPLNTYNYYIFNWLHGQPIWESLDCFVTVQAFANASGVGVFVPYGGGVTLREPMGATTTGR